MKRKLIERRSWFIRKIEKLFKALPHNSTRADWRENLCLKKAQNRRNTFCIARFCNAFVGQIGRQDVCGELCGDALKWKKATMSMDCPAHILTPSQITIIAMASVADALIFMIATGSRKAG